jgi:hypothetical protein
LAGLDLDHSLVSDFDDCVSKDHSMPAMEEFSIAAKEAQGWIDDLTSRLGWMIEGRFIAHCWRACTRCVKL